MHLNMGKTETESFLQCHAEKFNFFALILASWFPMFHGIVTVVRKAITDRGYTNLGCFAHTLQLIIQDSILSQHYVHDIFANCRRIVGHFKHSQLTSSRLKAIQLDLGLPQHRLKQDVATRWNSTLYMLKSILSQKVALAA